MTRDELIQAGVRAVKDRYYGTVADETTEGLIRQDVAVTVDAVEPLIRADERKTIVAEYVPVLMEHLRILADLRAKVEALRNVNHATGDFGQDYLIALDDVLVLLDGSSDGTA